MAIDNPATNAARRRCSSHILRVSWVRAKWCLIATRSDPLLGLLSLLTVFGLRWWSPSRCRRSPLSQRTMSVTPRGDTFASTGYARSTSIGLGGGSWLVTSTRSHQTPPKAQPEPRLPIYCSFRCLCGHNASRKPFTYSLPCLYIGVLRII